MPGSFRIAIVDDDAAIRESLQLLLFAEGHECLTFDSAQAFLNAGRETIDCLLLDIRMPGMDGLELFHQLRRSFIPYPVLFITGHGDIPLAVSAIKQGAYDFLTKPFRQGELLDKITQALQEYGVMRQQLAHSSLVQQRIESCTRRERQVLQLMMQGLSNKRIAEVLEISTRTVEAHRAQVMEKMQARSLPELMHLLGSLPKIG